MTGDETRSPRSAYSPSGIFGGLSRHTGRVSRGALSAGSRRGLNLESCPRSCRSNQATISSCQSATRQRPEGFSVRESCSWLVADDSEDSGSLSAGPAHMAGRGRSPAEPVRIGGWVAVRGRQSGRPGAQPCGGALNDPASPGPTAGRYSKLARFRRRWAPPPHPREGSRGREGTRGGRPLPRGRGAMLL